MIKVVLLGGGNVAHHLAKVFINSVEVSLIQVFNRTIESIQSLKNHVEIIDDYKKFKKADIYIICVSDTAIEKVSSKIPNGNGLVVHTSGSTSMEVLKHHQNRGVFYPLQTFSKNRSVNFSEIPICIEADNAESLKIVENLAKSISNSLYKIDSKQREKLHIAAVFVNNFVNHLYSIGNEICKEQQIQPTILYPLIKETAYKIKEINPFEAQTGPARRSDTKIIDKHLINLNQNQREIYKLLSDSITHNYGKKL